MKITKQNMQRFLVGGFALLWLMLSANTALADFTPGDCAGTDPVSYWKLEETGILVGAGFDYNDEAPGDEWGACNENAPHECPTRAAGQVGFGQIFSEGGDTGIDVGPYGVIDWSATSIFSLELWMKGTTVGGTDVLMGRTTKQAQPAGMEWFLGVSQGTSSATFWLESTASTSGDEDYVQIDGVTNVLDNQWHHIVVVRDGLNGFIQLWIDGELQGMSVASYTGTFSDGSQPLTIGYLNKGTFFHYSGSIDEVAIYDVALSEQDIWSHYLNGIEGVGYCTDQGPVIDVNTPTTLDSAVIGFNYEAGLFAAGNPQPDFSLGGDAPSGMSIPMGTNTITWQPNDTHLDDNTFEITASNTSGPDAMGDFSLEVVDLCRVSDPFLISYWALEEIVPDSGSSGTLLDSYGSHDGACDDTSSHTVCPEIVTGVLDSGDIDMGQSFGASTTGISIAAHADFNFSSADDFAVELWMKTSGADLQGTDVLFGRTDVPTDNMEWFIAMREITPDTNEGYPYVYFRDTNGDNTEFWGYTNLNDGEWHHVVLSRNGTDETIKIYIDGVLEAMQQQSFSGSFASTTSANLNIGFLNKVSFFHFSGDIDEVALYQKAPSDAIVLQHYSDGTPNSSYCNNIPVITGQAGLLSTPEETPLPIEASDLDITDSDNTYPDDFTVLIQDGVNYTYAGSTLTPDTDFNDELTVSVKVSDGTNSSAAFDLLVTVTATNDAPVITGQDPNPLSTQEEIPLTITLANVTVIDPDSDEGDRILMVQDGVNYTRSGNTITPLENFVGLLEVPVTVDDGSGTATSESDVFNMSVDVGQDNDAPVITGQVSTLSTPEETVLILSVDDLTISDPDSSVFTLVIQDGSDYVHSGDSVTPGTDFNGDLTVAVKVDDGSGQPTSLSASFDMTVTVTPINDRPVITGPVDTISTPEETPITITLDDLAIVDPDSDLVAFTLMVQGGTNYTREGNTITPAEDFVGLLNVIVKVDDGSGQANSESAEFDLPVDVGGVNDPPDITTTAPTTATEEILYSYDAHAIDTEGNAITWSLTNEPAGMVVDSESGLVTWTPGEETTSGIVTLTATDTFGGTDDELFQITVTGINDTPQITSTAPETAIQGVPYSYQATATDAEDDTLSWSLGNAPTGMTVDSVSGLVTWRPGIGVTTSGTVTVTVLDGNGGADSQQFTVTVREFNEAPEITSDAPTNAVEGSEYVYEPMATDEENDPLTWSITNAPVGMEVDSLTGRVTWTPGEGVPTSGPVTLTVTDDAGGTDSEIFSITVAADADSDGVTDQDERGINGTEFNYDGNGDSIADWNQSNVVSLATISGGSYVTLAAPDGTEIVAAMAAANPSSLDAPAGVQFQYGFFDFSVENVSFGSTTVTLYLPTGAQINAYYKYGPTSENPQPHWYSFLYDAASQTGAQINGNIITLYFRDGFRGDDDLISNGVIVDIGAPGFSSSSGNGDGGGGGGGGGGGCFIDTVSAETTSSRMPILPANGLVLSLAALGLGVMRSMGIWSKKA